MTKKLVPKHYSLNPENYGLYFNNINRNTLIKKAMLTVDLSLEAIHFALKHRISVIISHHGLVKEPIKKFSKNIIKKLNLLSKYPISIFLLNSSFIAAEGGVSDTLMNVLYLKMENTLEVTNKLGIKTPIGRICSPLKYPNEKHPFTLEALIKRLKENLSINAITFVGELTRPINRICIVGGDISNSTLIKKAINLNCDCFVSGKIDYFDAVLARDSGLNLVETSHYEIENVSMKRLSNILSLEFPQVEFILFESKDPFKTYI
ncbi:MAG: Nif3-like dinuclear metal center hexameric protein [Promethearchaeota archaeon]